MDKTKILDINTLGIQNLSFKFSGSDRYFFNNLSMNFQAGRLHLIKGSNGIGKSTFFRLLQGKLDSNEMCNGTIHIQKTVHDLSKVSSKLAFSIQKVPQKFELMIADQCSFIENLSLASIHVPGLRRLSYQINVPDLVKRFDIDERKPVKLLSGGQKQILAILMALQKPVSVLLLDEPTSALDEKNTQAVFEFLEFLVKESGIIVIAICHDQNVLRRFSEHHTYELLFDKKRGERQLIKC